MRVMHFARVVHRVSNRVRFSVAARRGDAVYFAQLEEAFLRSARSCLRAPIRWLDRS